MSNTSKDTKPYYTPEQFREILESWESKHGLKPGSDARCAVGTMVRAFVKETKGVPDEIVSQETMQSGSGALDIAWDLYITDNINEGPFDWYRACICNDIYEPEYFQSVFDNVIDPLGLTPAELIRISDAFETEEIEINLPEGGGLAMNTPLLETE